MPGYVYMLRCADDSLYVGSTRDLPTRFHQHQIGEGSTYTRDRLPVELVWYEEYGRISHAFAREKQIQNWGRAKRLALIDGNYEGLPALAKKDFSKRRRPVPPPLVE
ncbi:putative endonuclease [Nocardioides sp. BE266]|uniref:GIY-YIG nuclease family protein n=1 Tax=Nocardioides sp. BE266 TaxID=2817725 RepID=UPI0028636223|nr:GIY-YIG nuclease family protein [Nocardioides sp. BE266]MDR7254518.1 putative endonuclease [Nocardioides sp. BE266]